jgi:peptide/nickel transport system permease protein
VGQVLAFVMKRLVWAVILAWLITLICFVIFFVLPRNQPGANRQGIVQPQLNTAYDLHSDSLPRQYVTFLQHVVRGDLGQSLRQPEDVRTMIHDAAPVTLTLMIGGTIFFLLIAFPIGILSALYPRSFIDKGLMAFVLIGVSCHPVWLGLIFSYTLGYKAHLFPIAGYCAFILDPNNPYQCGGPRYWAYHMVLPWFTFALLFAAYYARMIRASLLETMEEDYVRTARAKGAGQWRILRKHVMHNAMIPVVAMLSMDMVVISFTGIVFIETVFQLPGLGRVLYQALTSADLPVILGISIVVCFAVVIANLIADIVYAIIDPTVNLTGRRRVSLWSRLRVGRPQPPVESQGAQASS